MTVCTAKLKANGRDRSFWNSTKPELLVVLGYLLCYCVISAYHEPWFDEAQSWEIARCENIFRLLFFIPHYEGNPPLWYLILMLPAKLGIPFEWGLKSIGLIISLCFVCVIEFKAPFPKLFKLCIPFTYFLFYQYGIIVRPYALMILAFLLVAITFKARDRNPWKFVICLAFLAETSSFCVVVAGCIAACWLFEIIRESLSIRKLLRDVRIHALFALLLFALVLVATVLPRKDALFLLSYLEGGNSRLVCIFVALTTALSETLLVTSPWFSTDQANLAYGTIFPGPLITSIAAQMVILTMICCFSSKKNLKYFVVPYGGYALFGGYVLIGGHYLGVGYCVFLFWLWINCMDDHQFEIGKSLAHRLRITNRDVSLLKRFSLVLCALSILVSLVWSIRSAWKEIQVQYSFGRETFHFLNETSLDQAKIATMWYDNSKETCELDYGEMNLQSYGVATPIAAYAGKNIVYNFNGGQADAGYVQFIKLSAEQNQAAIESWKRFGAPDVLLGEANVELLTDGAVSIKDYTPVFEMENHYIWKGNTKTGMQYVFVRTDLLDKHDLTPIERPAEMFGNYKLDLNDDMRERYKNGEDINDILKPYLDYIFGEESDVRN